MKLIWHLAKKDLRHLWPWLALLTATIVARYGIAWHLEHSAVIKRPFFDRTSDIADGLLALQLILAGLFVALVIHADTPLSDRAFWLTRPIAGLRLVAAKLLTIVLGAILLPLTGVLLWWWLHDYRWCETTAALPNMLTRYGFLAVSVFTLALFTRNLAGLLLTFFASLLVLAGLAALSDLSPKVPGTLSTTRFMLMMVCSAAILLTCTWLLYHRRRVLLAKSLVAVAVLLCLLIRHVWTWDLERQYRFDKPVFPTIEEGKASYYIRAWRIISGPWSLRVQAKPLLPALTFSPPVTKLLTYPAAPPPQSRFLVTTALTGLPANHIVHNATASLLDKGNAATASVRAIQPAAFAARPPPLLTSTTPPESPVVTLHLDHISASPNDSASPSPHSPAELKLRLKFHLRRVDTIASLNLSTDKGTHTGPYAIRHISVPTEPGIADGALNLLLTRPGHLTAPGVGYSESSGTVTDTDEYGRNSDKNSLIYAFTKGDPIFLNLKSWLTFSVDDVHFVRRAYTAYWNSAGAPDEIRCVIYPLLGTFERDLAVQLPPTASATP